MSQKVHVPTPSSRGRIRGLVRSPTLAQGAILVAAVLVLMVSGVQLHQRNGTRQDSWRLVTQTTTLQPVNNPVLWLQYGGTPTAADIARAAATARIIVLNAYELDALRAIKRLNPKVTVLVYKDISSTRSYPGAVDNGQDAPLLPTGVGYVAATRHPEWFAVDDHGERIQWSGYDRHWQMAVWNASYRDAWTANVTEEVKRNGWDGVLADNALSTLKYYISRPLGGGASDAVLSDGVTKLVEQAGQALQAQQHLLIPNIGDGRLDPGRFERLSRYGGGFEEQYLHVQAGVDDGHLGDPADGKGINGSDSSSSDWDRQATEVAGTSRALVHTQAVPGDRRSFLYGYASFLIAGGGTGAFSATGPDRYNGLVLWPEQQWTVPVTSALPHKTEVVRYRWFPTLFAAANPSDRVATVTLPISLANDDGQVSSTLTLPPRTGVLLRRQPGPSALDLRISVKQ